MCEQTLLRVGAGVPHPETSSEHNLRFSSQNLQKFDPSSAPQTPTSPGPGPDGDRIHQQPDAMDEGLHTPDFGLAGRHSSPPSTAMGAQVRPGDQAQAAEMSLTRSHQSSDSDELASAATDSNPKSREDYLREYGGDFFNDYQIDNAFTYPHGSSMLERFIEDDTGIGSLHAYACGLSNLVDQLPRYQPGCLVSSAPAPPQSEIPSRDRRQNERPSHLGVGRMIEISQRRQCRKHGVVKKQNHRIRRTGKPLLTDLNSVDLK